MCASTVCYVTFLKTLHTCDNLRRFVLLHSFAMFLTAENANGEKDNTAANAALVCSELGCLAALLALIG